MRSAQTAAAAISIKSSRRTLLVREPAGAVPNGKVEGAAERHQERPEELRAGRVPAEKNKQEAASAAFFICTTAQLGHRVASGAHNLCPQGWRASPAKPQSVSGYRGAPGD